VPKNGFQIENNFRKRCQKNYTMVTKKPAIMLNNSAFPLSESGNRTMKFQFGSKTRVSEKNFFVDFFFLLATSSKFL